MDPHPPFYTYSPNGLADEGLSHILKGIQLIKAFDTDSADIPLIVDVTDVTQLETSTIMKRLTNLQRVMKAPVIIVDSKEKYKPFFDQSGYSRIFPVRESMTDAIAYLDEQYEGNENGYHYIPENSNYDVSLSQLV